MILFNIYIKDILNEIKPVTVEALHNSISRLTFEDYTVILADNINDLRIKYNYITNLIIDETAIITDNINDLQIKYNYITNLIIDNVMEVNVIKSGIMYKLSHV